MSPAQLSMNLATLRNGSSFAQMVEDCLRHGVIAVSPWRDQVASIGLSEAASIVRSNGLRVTGLCRGGMFPADTPAGRQAAIDDNTVIFFSSDNGPSVDKGEQGGSAGPLRAGKFSTYEGGARVPAMIPIIPRGTVSIGLVSTVFAGTRVVWKVFPSRSTVSSAVA